LLNRSHCARLRPAVLLAAARRIESVASGINSRINPREYLPPPPPLFVARSITAEAFIVSREIAARELLLSPLPRVADRPREGEREIDG